jgi:hypothetical protein
VLSIGFMAAFPIVGSMVVSEGWRTAWAGIGFCLLPGLVVIAWLLVRRGPEECGLPIEGETSAEAKIAVTGYTWQQALRTPAFWVFALASSVYNLVASGIGLFNESILVERGFAPGITTEVWSCAR